MKTINLIIKRLFDVMISLTLCVILFPLAIVIVMVIKLTMPGPIFFKQERVGKNQKKFIILKFRTMKIDLEAQKNFDFSKDEERLTKFGKVLRRTKLDEVPQLLNVLNGSMSLVGPRPTVQSVVDGFTERQKMRFKMTPGMTGLAQVNGNTAISWDERIEYDLKYIDDFSVIMDIKILLKTVGVVLFGEEKFRKG